MKNIILLLFSLLALSSCHKMDVGYLKTTAASYQPDSLVIRKTLDEEIDKVLIKNDAPWVTRRLEGVLGTPPINYRILEVKALEGGNAELFRQELTVRGVGVMEVPLRFQAPKGRYRISLEAYNQDHTSALTDIFTFIVKE